MSAAPSTKHEPPSPPTTPTQLNVDETTRVLQAQRVRIADFFYPKDGNIDPVAQYFPAINSCIHDLYLDHRGTNSAEAWITS
jgi:hypothetical protein